MHHSRRTILPKRSYLDHWRDLNRTEQLMQILIAGFLPPLLQVYHELHQWFGSRLDPDGVGSLDLDPGSESGTESRSKMTHKIREKLRNFCFEVLDVLC